MMTVNLPQLTASTGAVELTAAAQPVDMALTTAGVRQVSGLVLPYGPTGYTSVGPVRVPEPGRLSYPADLSRVKLMDYHQSPPVAIGVCTALRETPVGLRASFTVANTPAADAAWGDLQSGLRDGLSVELAHIDVQGDELHAGLLLGVSLVPVPAWDDARHDGLAAARADTTQEESTTPMTPEERARLAELVAMNARTDDEESEYTALVRKLATAPDPAEQTTDQPDPALTASAAGQLTVPGAGAPAAAPVGVPGGERAPQRPLVELYAATARVLSGHSRPELEAALSDITGTANIWTSQSAYDGQLWSGLEYVRRFVTLMTAAPLTSYKGTGWRWKVKPEVADYAGDKTDVPSNAPETEATDWAAARLAGAHDIDRKFWDFGDTEFIAAYYAALTEDYALKSDMRALAKLLAIANANVAVGGATSLLGATVRAADAVMTGTNGVKPDYFLVSGADLLTTAEDGSMNKLGDNPMLEAFGVSPDKFVVAPGLAAGEVVAGIKQASRWRELGTSPIRVETINLAKGGVDGGVFGYYATETVHARGIRKATFVRA